MGCGAAEAAPLRLRIDHTARLKSCPSRLLFLVFAFGGCGFLFRLGLRFGLFHRFLGFGGLLGAGFGTLLALFVQNLLAAQQLEEGLVGAVALIPGGADDACVFAVAIAEAWSDRIKQL